MKRRLIYTTLVALILVLSLSLSSCIYLGYQGEDIDLFTTAANNVFAIYGSATNGEATYSPTIRVIEKDDYGRVLFFYNEIGKKPFSTFRNVPRILTRPVWHSMPTSNTATTTPTTNNVHPSSVNSRTTACTQLRSKISMPRRRQYPHRDSLLGFPYLRRAGGGI